MTLKDIGETSKPRIVKFYKRFGFIEERKTSCGQESLK